MLRSVEYLNDVKEKKNQIVDVDICDKLVVTDRMNVKQIRTMQSNLSITQGSPLILIPWKTEKYISYFS